MFEVLRHRYRVLRGLPRAILISVERLPSEIATIRAQRDDSFRLSSIALRDIHADITGFCNEATKAILELKRSTDEEALQSALVARSLRTVDTLLRGMLNTRAAEQAAVIQAQEEARAAAAAAAQDQKEAKAAEHAEAIQARDEALAAIAAAAQDREDIKAAVTTEIQRLSDHVDQQNARLVNLAAIIAEQSRIYPSWVWSEEDTSRVRAVLDLLHPVAIPGTKKLRIGRDRDGGYIMLDDFTGIAAALSLGIADDVSWDVDIASYGIPVLQFDPSVADAPEANNLFRFERLRVAPRDGDGVVSLATILATRLAVADGPLLLKIDIEGDEWEVFRTMDDALASRFRQIVCEFHNLERLCEAPFASVAAEVFSKLARTHVVHHVHGNNCANFTNVGNVIIPQSLEVSFAARNAYISEPGRFIFPTPLDRPNEPGRADLYLGSFEFEARENDISSQSSRL